MDDELEQWVNNAVFAGLKGPKALFEFANPDLLWDEADINVRAPFEAYSMYLQSTYAAWGYDPPV